MKTSHILIGAAALGVAYLLFSKKDSSGESAGLGGGLFGSPGGLLGAITPKESQENAALANMAANFRNANITPALMQAKYNEFLTGGVDMARNLLNVPTNQYTRNTPTGQPLTQMEQQQAALGLVQWGQPIGTVGVIAPKYTPNSIIATTGGGFVKTDSVGNIVQDSRAIINQGTGQQAYNATILSGGSAVAAVEAKRQAEIAWVKSKG